MILSQGEKGHSFTSSHSPVVRTMNSPHTGLDGVESENNYAPLVELSEDIRYSLYWWGDCTESQLPLLLSSPHSLRSQMSSPD